MRWPLLVMWVSFELYAWLALITPCVIILFVQRFRDDDARRLLAGETVRRLPREIQRRARARLERVLAARALTDLRLPPSHRLEGLRGDRVGQFSIRINDQWRVCFVWTEQGAVAIEIVDYH